MTQEFHSLPKGKPGLPGRDGIPGAKGEPAVVPEDYLTPRRGQLK
jgi:hypothetical protein